MNLIIKTYDCLAMGPVEYFCGRMILGLVLVVIVSVIIWISMFFGTIIRDWWLRRKQLKK